MKTSVKTVVYCTQNCVIREVYLVGTNLKRVVYEFNSGANSVKFIRNIFM